MRDMKVGYKIQLGMEYPKSYRIPDNVITVKNKIGKYTKKFTNAGGYARVYLKGIARNYTSKSIIINGCRVHTGTIYHKVTKGEVNRDKITLVAVGIVLVFVPGGQITMKEVGIGSVLFGAACPTFQQGNYIVSKISFKQSTGKTHCKYESV